MKLVNLIDFERELVGFRQALQERAEEETHHAVSIPVAEELHQADLHLQEAQEHLLRARLIQEELIGAFE